MSDRAPSLGGRGYAVLQQCCIVKSAPLYKSKIAKSLMLYNFIFKSTFTTKSLSNYTGKVQNIASSVMQYCFKPSQRTRGNYSEFEHIDHEYLKRLEQEEESMNENASEFMGFKLIDTKDWNIDEDDQKEVEILASEPVNNHGNGNIIMELKSQRNFCFE
jgi:hypothetical protein